jgi:glycosyltransferase involved in cell wall biosynthesis
MAITLVLHEATRTGAPRLGALIARELQRREEVRVVVMKDGPLTPWLMQTLGSANVDVRPGEPFEYRRPFEERVRLAREMLERAPSDLVYVNSLAASVFALAAAELKRKTLLHIHEKSAEMANLLLHDVTKLEVMRIVDAAVLAAEDIRADLVEVFRYAPPEIETFGVAVDVEAVRAGAAAPAPPALNARGAALRRGERMIVGMSGHASPRKGVDIFLETAAALPEHDFLWVGGWRPEETVDNIAYEDFERAALPNLYIAGAVDNPYPYLAMMDLFFLSSREDPNPLVLGEALVLGLPILCFSHTTGVADRLGRFATVCYGDANAADAVRVLRASSASALRRPEFRSVGEAYVADYDLRAKMTKISDLIARLRGKPATPPATDAVRRDLKGGIVELSFT